MAKIETVSCRTDVAIVDDDENIRLSLKDILQSTGDFNFAGGFSNAGEALARLPDLRPDLTLMDIRLPDLNGIECTKRLRQCLPDLKIVFVTGMHDPVWVEASLSVGAAAFLFKPFDPDQLLATLKLAVSASWKTDSHSNEVANISISKRSAAIPLNFREKEVLKYLAAGLLYKEISDKMGISYAAVHKCQHNIFKKLHVSNRSEAIRVWFESGHS
jgi:DNA-binding NarL/FixJ family response regulator